MSAQTTPDQQVPVQPTPEVVQQAFQLMTGHIVASAVNIAARLALPDRLAQGPRAADDLARETRTNPDALYRLLRALSGVGVFVEGAGRTFALTPVRDGPVRWMALWIGGEFNFHVYANAMHSIMTGEPAVPLTVGEGAFEHFAKNPELSKVFNDAMTGFSSVVVPAVLESYDFSGVRTLVDIAGGHGAVLTAILQKHPSMKGILMDLEHVIGGARPKIEAQGLADRVTTTTGDFFKAVPSGGDAYVMKHIIHDWDDEKAALILSNIRNVLPKDGRVILIEAVVRGGQEGAMSKVMDLEMLVMPGGRERTEEEFRALFDRAGFNLTRIVPTNSPLSVIEARPKP
jgi:hypothetical protein